MNFEPTQVNVDLLLYASNPATLIVTYSQIEVLRSLGEEGPYVAITAPAATKATLSAGREGPYQLHDTVINLLLEDNTTLDYQFTGADPLSAADAAVELNTASPLLDCYDDSGTLVLRTASTGNKAFIKVEGGDALYWLDIHLNDVAYGLSANPVLSGSVYTYQSSDGNGDLGYGYRYRFMKPAPLAYSTMLTPVAVGRDLTIDIAHLSIGTLKSSQISGMSDYGNRVHIANRYIPPSINDALVNGDRIVDFDTSGVANVVLLRGSKIEFYVPGSPVHRVIVVPDLPTFDMLDPSLSVDDPWGIIVPPYTSLPRTTP